MGLKRFFQNAVNLGKVELQDDEQRSQNVFSILNNAFSKFWFGFNGSDIDCSVTSLSAMQVATVYTCVLVNAETISSLPASVKQVTSQGSRTATEHPAHKLIHDKPNPFQTASDFWKTVSAHIDLYGNCFAIVSYSGSFRPKRLDIISDPNAVQIQRTDSGEAYYEYDGNQYKWYEILHFKDLSLDGYYGCSKIGYNASTIGYSKKLRNYGTNAVGNKPPGYFSSEQNYDVVKKAEGSLQSGWKDNIDNGKTPVLPFGLKYNSLLISPGEAQYLEAIGATKEDICGIFRVPPTLVQNYLRATFSNAEQQDLVFFKYTILPKITNIEQECNAKLFAEGNDNSLTPYYVKFNANALLRGDLATRTEAYRTLFNIGAINGDMIAELEDWNRWEGGDQRFVPMNMIPLDKVGDFVDTLTEPVGSTAPDPGGSQHERGWTISQLKAFLIKTSTNGHKVNGHES